MRVQTTIDWDWNILAWIIGVRVLDSDRVVASLNPVERVFRFGSDDLQMRIDALILLSHAQQIWENDCFFQRIRKNLGDLLEQL